MNRCISRFNNSFNPYNSTNLSGGSGLAGGSPWELKEGAWRGASTRVCVVRKRKPTPEKKEVYGSAHCIIYKW